MADNGWERGWHTMQALVTDLDMLKLADCLEGQLRWPGQDREHVEALRRKVNSARVVRSDDILRMS
jgi:hypothetical protein